MPDTVATFVVWAREVGGQRCLTLSHARHPATGKRAISTMTTEEIETELAALRRWRALANESRASAVVWTLCQVGRRVRATAGCVIELRRAWSMVRLIADKQIVAGHQIANPTCAARDRTPHRDP